MLFEFRTFRETILWEKGGSSNRPLPGNSKYYKEQELSFNNGHYWSYVSLRCDEKIVLHILFFIIEI